MLWAVAIMLMNIIITRAIPRVMSTVLTLLVRRLLRLYLRGIDKRLYLGCTYYCYGTVKTVEPDAVVIICGHDGAWPFIIQRYSWM